MISELSLIEMIMLGTPILLSVMFLPTLIEVRRPRDSGPRSIRLDFSPVLADPIEKASVLVDMEGNPELEIMLKSLVRGALSVLPSLED